MDPNGLVVFVDEALFRTTGRSLGLTFPLVISSHLEKGEIVTGVKLMYCCVPELCDAGCRGSSNIHLWYLNRKLENVSIMQKFRNLAKGLMHLPCKCKILRCILTCWSCNALDSSCAKQISLHSSFLHQIRHPEKE